MVIPPLYLFPEPPVFNNIFSSDKHKNYKTDQHRDLIQNSNNLRCQKELKEKLIF